MYLLLSLNLEGIIYVGGPPLIEDDISSNVIPGSPRVLACKNQATNLTGDTLVKLIGQYRLEGKVIFFTTPHVILSLSYPGREVGYQG